MKARGLRVVAVAQIDATDFDQDKALIVSTAEKHDIHYSCFLDNDGGWMLSSGIDDVPAFMVIDKRGHVVHKQQGRLMLGSKPYNELKAAIEAAMAVP